MLHADPIDGQPGHACRLPTCVFEPGPQAVEQTIQNLIGSGMDPKTDNNPYYGFIYTSFQVKARLRCPRGDITDSSNLGQHMSILMRCVCIATWVRAESLMFISLHALFHRCS